MDNSTLDSTDKTEASTVTASEVRTEVEKPDIGSPGGFRSRITGIIAAILPLVQSIPPLWIWGGLMTIPLISYLALMFTSSPMNFFVAFFTLFFGGFIWELILAAIGLVMLVFSIVYLRRGKKAGLVRTGPYGLVRHPQYLGVCLFTLTQTTRSYWIITHTIGMGFLGPNETLAVWFVTLLAYMILAGVEELHLGEVFGVDYQDYRRDVGFIVPYLKTENRGLEILISFVVLALILFGVVYLNDIILSPPIF
ncbi:MAG: isoprenylcysteine carboxylmethyltransferase family protein [Candidatus Thorarchaeota archaeon]|nr:MAG: isoprenylcysteine carboxylmethyltransferase family protein [Candidatus Thorarchaeota archaeon]